MHNKDFDPLGSDVTLRGLHIGLVVDNNDPKYRERVLVRIIGIHDMENTSLDNAIWAERCAPFKMASGDLPDPGDYVWVLFPDSRNPMTVVWLGWVRGNIK